MERIRDFAAIDFETANGQRTSVCSVGVVVVRGGRPSESIYRLIRPYPNYYSAFTTAIHGLTRSDTENAPSFPDVWGEIAPRIEGLPLVAHNSPFDEGCLRAVHAHYGLPYPDYRFLWYVERFGAVGSKGCPTISSIRSPQPADTCSNATTMHWPTPKPVRRSPCGFSDSSAAHPYRAGISLTNIEIRFVSYFWVKSFAGGAGSR